MSLKWFHKVDNCFFFLHVVSLWLWLFKYLNILSIRNMIHILVDQCSGLSSNLMFWMFYSSQLITWWTALIEKWSVNWKQHVSAGSGAYGGRPWTMQLASGWYECGLVATWRMKIAINSYIVEALTCFRSIGEWHFVAT